MKTRKQLRYTHTHKHRTSVFIHQKRFGQRGAIAKSAFPCTIQWKWTRNHVTEK